MNKSVPAKFGILNRFLNVVERLGNKLPHITMLFIYALIFTMLLSLALSYVDFDYIHPNTHEKIKIINMFTPDNLLTLVINSVKNFMGFPPLGITIVATLGIGIAEGSGFVKVLIRKFLSITPKKFLTPTVIFVSIVCHIVSDSAYTILMPVSALIFYASGRHPLAGIACSFAGLAGGFTASYTPSIIDPIMQGFTEAASHSIDPNYSVNVLCNYFYALGGTFFIIGAIWFVTDKVVEPRLWATMPLDESTKTDKTLVIEDVTPLENKAYYAALATVVPLLFIFFSVPGLVYGYVAGTFKKSRDVIASMENIMKMLLSFIVFCFFAGQFLYVFGASNIGSLLAISGAEFLKNLGMPSGITLFGIIILTAMLNVLITSATSKWAILSTIFVPMLMMLGISPELTQAAFRVSDSAVNVCTPLFPFYPLLILYCQRYCKKSGVGTLSSMMLPYTFALLIVLTAVLYAYWMIGIPLGFNSGFDYPSTMYPQP